MVDIHFISWNRPKMTQLAIGTIHRNTREGNYHLHVLDNGSDKETTDMLQKMFDAGLLHSYTNLPKNMGLEFARQYLLEKYTYGDYFIDADNDCLPPPIVKNQDWIDRLSELMARYEGYGAISCRTQVMIGTGNIFEDDTLEITPFPHPGGSLRIMDTHAIVKVRGWDRESSGRGSEEKYICGKLNAAGYKTGFATHIQCLHLFGTRGDNGTDRWGYDPNFNPEMTGHSDIWHPALANGDDPEVVETYAGKELTEAYFAHSYNQAV
jgi:glycosyltransferase involved in cell wall biosynthesis